MKNIDETRNYFNEEIKQNDLMSKKHKSVCSTLSYIEHLFILASAVTGCVSISGFASLMCIATAISSCRVAITAGIKGYKPIIKKKKKKHDKSIASEN